MAFSKEKKLCFWLTMLNLKPLFHVSCSSKTSLSLSLSLSLSPIFLVAFDLITILEMEDTIHILVPFQF